MKMSNTQYGEMAKEASAPSKSWRNIPKAFVIGGLICLAGQGLLEMFGAAGLARDEAAAYTSVTLVMCSAILTAVGLYPKVAKHGGAGTLVPITGFANAVVSPAIEYRTEGWVLGVGAKVFAIAGPVILYGTVASMIYGVVYWGMGVVGVR